MFDKGEAVNPWAKTLIKTVMKTTEIKVVSPGNTFSSSKTKSASTIDAKPLGPNQPIKRIVFMSNLVPINDMATGNILMMVKLKTE